MNATTVDVAVLGDEAGAVASLRDALEQGVVGGGHNELLLAVPLQAFDLADDVQEVSPSHVRHRGDGVGLNACRGLDARDSGSGGVALEHGGAEDVRDVREQGAHDDCGRVRVRHQNHVLADGGIAAELVRGERHIADDRGRFGNRRVRVGGGRAASHPSDGGVAGLRGDGDGRASQPGQEGRVLHADTVADEVDEQIRHVLLCDEASAGGRAVVHLARGENAAHAVAVERNHDRVVGGGNLTAGAVEFVGEFAFKTDVGFAAAERGQNVGHVVGALRTSADVRHDKGTGFLHGIHLFLERVEHGAHFGFVPAASLFVFGLFFFGGGGFFGFSFFRFGFGFFLGGFHFFISAGFHDGRALLFGLVVMLIFG